MCTAGGPKRVSNSWWRERAAAEGGSGACAQQEGQSAPRPEHVSNFWSRECTGAEGGSGVCAQQEGQSASLIFGHFSYFIVRRGSASNFWFSGERWAVCRTNNHD
jgi:hypothetical protein